MAVSEERTRKRNEVIHSEASEHISKVIQTCDEEARMKELAFPVSQATKRAAEYCGKSETLIKKIRKERKTRVEKGSGGKLPTPGKKRNTRPENTKVQVDDFDKWIIRNISHDFYATKKEVPTAAKLLPIVSKKINFQWARKSLTRVMKSIGFTWRKCNLKRHILIEKPKIVSWYHKYLVQMKRFREEGKEIFYVDESWVDTNITFSKCWQGETEFGIKEITMPGTDLLQHTSACRK
jgi:hypothetical protein